MLLFAPLKIKQLRQSVTYDNCSDSGRILENTPTKFIMNNNILIFSISLALVSSSVWSDDDSQADDSHRLVITGLPMQKSIEGGNAQLDEFDNHAIIDAGDLLTEFPGFPQLWPHYRGHDPYHY